MDPHPDPFVHHARERRTIFYPKADLAVPDAVLRALPGGAAEELSRNAGYARAQLARFMGCDAAATELRPLLQQGTFHHVFEGGPRGLAPRHLVRVNRLAEHFVGRQLMADAIVGAALAGQGIRSAKVFDVDISRRHVPTDTEILERLEGATIADHDHDDRAIGPHLAALAAQLRNVHAIDGSGAGFVDVSNAARLTGVHATWDKYIFTQLGNHIETLEGTGLMTPAAASAARAAFDAARPALARVQPRLLHGDPGNHNVVLCGEELVLVDWEDALLGDPLFDVAFWATFHPERRWGTFFDAYFGPGWQPTRRFWLYFLRVALCKTVHRLRFGYTDKPGRPPASARIQRALDGLQSTEGAAA